MAQHGRLLVRFLSYNVGVITGRNRAPAVQDLPQPDLRDIAVDRVLRALGEPVRLHIVRTLAGAEHPMPCGAFDLGVTKSTSTHHFRVLRESGVISQYGQGTARYSRLRTAELEDRFPGLLDAVLGAR